MSNRLVSKIRLLLTATIGLAVASVFYSQTWAVAQSQATSTAKPSRDNITLQETDNLYALAKLARDKQLPILVMFAQDDCLYCELVREDFLNPMLQSGEYDDKVIIRQLHIDSFDEVRNFNGKMIDVEELDVNYGAYLTPTVVFLDPNGYELSPRIIGVVNEYFYGEQLDAAIDNSLTKLRKINAR